MLGKDQMNERAEHIYNEWLGCTTKSEAMDILDRVIELIRADAPNLAALKGQTGKSYIQLRSED